MSDEVPIQVLKGHRLAKFIEETRMTLGTLSALTHETKNGGLSTASLSLFVNEIRPALSLNGQIGVFDVMDFARGLIRRSNGIPVDFNNLPEMKKLFRAWIRAGRDVVKTDAEESAEAVKA
jgi:hypothetical protein